ncbi:hypothetical protein ACIP6P_31205 [Streptomyces sp. NPDC088729]|uniref:hypothetical protein n=1 Tax=Streptomyces sp. NPDC088729 TaxID=3365876 RepID=UPI003820E527
MRSIDSQDAGADDPHEASSLTVVSETPSVARGNRRARPDVAGEPDPLHGPHEATRSQAHRARIKKAAVSAGRLAVAADEKDRELGKPHLLLQRAAALLRVIGTIAGTDVRLTATPTALRVDVTLNAELSMTEHQRLLAALVLADRFGHSITRRDGEQVWVSYELTTRSGPVPRARGATTPVRADAPTTFYTAHEGSRDGEYHPPV